jgi:hypothetical protein
MMKTFRIKLTAGDQAVVELPLIEARRLVLAGRATALEPLPLAADVVAGQPQRASLDMAGVQTACTTRPVLRS